MTDAPQDTALEPVSSAAPEPAAGPVPAPAVPPPPPDPAALPTVSPEDPCGPDLDLEGDGDFLNFVAATEGMLPGSRAEDYYKFNRAEADFPGRFQTAEKLLKRTLDVRVLALLAKLSILNRDVKGFARWIGSLAWLLREHWDGAHPRAEGGDYSARLGQLMTIEENSVVLLPLQYAPLPRNHTRRRALLSRPAGGDGRRPAAVRHALQRKGREGNERRRKIHAAKNDRAAFARRRNRKTRRPGRDVRYLSRALQMIKSATIEHVGYEKAIELPRLDKLIREMTEFARGALITRDPSLAPLPEAAGAVGEGGGHLPPPPLPSPPAPKSTPRSPPPWAISRLPSRPAQRCS